MKPSSTNRRPPGPLAAPRKLKLSPEQTLGWMHSKSPPGILISENYWQRRFGGDPALVGKTVKLNGIAFSIIGITPRDFMGSNLNVPNFWLPLRDQPLLHPGSDVLGNRENPCCRLYGRLGRDIRLSEAQAEMNLLAKQLRALHAPHSDAGKPMTIQLYPGSPFGRDVDTGLKFAIVLIMCAVGMVLLIACANLASLQLARSAARQKRRASAFPRGEQGQAHPAIVDRECVTGSIIGGRVSVAHVVSFALDCSGNISPLDTLTFPVQGEQKHSS